MALNYLPWRWWIGAAFVLVLDRWLKTLAVHAVNADWGWCHFHLVKNYGLVFSWPAPNWMIYGLLMAAVIVVSVLLVRYLRRDLVVSGAASLMLAGAASNLFDRWHYGFVIDWADLGRWFPVFNLADVMLTVGLILIITRRSLTSRD